MKILITGGAGFIGSELIKKLLSTYEIIEIISLDNYSSGNIKNHVNSQNVKYIKGNTWDIKNIEEIEKFEPNIVFHFGEFSRIVLSFQKQNDTFWSNGIGTQQVLEYCLRKKCKLVYSGSSAIFENSNLNPYVFTKSKNIELIKNYKKWFDLDYAICYFYNVYGENHIKEGCYATVLGIFEKQYENNEPLTIVKPGTQTRTFTHISDIISGILLVAENGDGDNYHLYSNDKYSILDIAKMFNTNYKFIDKRKGERINSVSIKSRAKIELGWKPCVILKDYIFDFCNKVKKSNK